MLNFLEKTSKIYMLTLFDKKNERLLFEMKKQLKIEEIGV